MELRDFESRVCNGIPEEEMEKLERVVLGLFNNFVREERYRIKTSKVFGQPLSDENLEQYRKGIDELRKPLGFSNMGQFRSAEPESIVPVERYTDENGEAVEKRCLKTTFLLRNAIFHQGSDGEVYTWGIIGENHPSVYIPDDGSTEFNNLWEAMEIMK